MTERMAGMRVIFAGTPEVAVPSLRALIDSGLDVVGVITREDAPLGRRRVLTPSPVAAAAEELGLTVRKANVLDAATTEWAGTLDADLGVIVAYGGLVRQPLLALPDRGWINLHFSDLPRWRGAAPVQRALIAGEQELGVTAFRLVPELDAGDVLARDSFRFDPGTSAGEVLDDLAVRGTATLLRALERVAADAEAGEPQVGEPSYAHKLDRADGRLDPALSADRVLAHWAGTTPEPGAWVETDGSAMKILELRPLQSEPGTRHPAGTVVLEGGAAILHCGSGALELARVQPSGKQGMAAADWVRGRGARAVLR